MIKSIQSIEIYLLEVLISVRGSCEFVGLDVAIVSHRLGATIFSGSLLVLILWFCSFI